MRRLIALCALLLLGASPAKAPPADAPLTLSDMPLHDPWIVADRQAGLYRLYTSNQRAMTGDPALGIMEYDSHDLKRWKRPRLVFALPSGGWANAGAWAPEVHRWRGRWYLLATFYNDAARLPGGGVRRGTVLAVADTPGGPFTPVRDGAPIVEPSRMTLDGTLYIDPRGRPWLVYAHEWVQIGNGTIEALPLDDALAAAGAPVTLFHAADAPWVNAKPRGGGGVEAVTDGPELLRTRTGALLMLWSSYDRDGYVQGLARSHSGEVTGPWEQLAPLVRRDSGHGMVFRRFDGTLMLVLHRPFRNARGKLYEVSDAGDTLAVVREATELDGNLATPAPSRPTR